MYYSFGNDVIVENIKSVSQPFFPESNSLHAAYHRFLESCSIFEHTPEWDKTKIGNFDCLKAVSPNFSQEKSFHFKKNSMLLEKRINNGFFYNALERFKKIDVNIYNLMTLLIRLIVVNHLNSYTNGTLSDTLGLSIMNFKDHFEEEDFMELVFHQLVHMSLFLDDRIKLHMSDKNKDCMIKTNLVYVHGGSEFPAYIAFHSYMVGVEMLCFRKHNNRLSFQGAYHGDTKRIVRVTKRFQDSLLENKHLFLDRGLSILEVGEKILANYTHKASVYV